MTPIITLERISKQFGSHRILQDFDLVIAPGETMTILGGSGTGKSVALRLILGLLAPDAGTVRFLGADITQLTDDELRNMRKQIGMLFQSGALFDSLTVFENIAYPLREHFAFTETELTERVAECLEMVGLPGIEHKMPADLSGGMRKRVGLARAIATKPQVILYDEPTTGLDPTNTRRISLLIRELQERLHVTSIVVTHDMDSAFLMSDRLALLHDQHVAYVGTVDDARASREPLISHFIAGRMDEIATV